MTKAKPKSALEIRAEHAKGLAAVDLARAETVKEIFSRPEMTAALEELREIYDPTPTTTMGTAGTDINALIRSGITLLENMGSHADNHIAAQNAILNPPEPVALTPDGGTTDAPAPITPTSAKTPES